MFKENVAVPTSISDKVEVELVSSSKDHCKSFWFLLVLKLPFSPVKLKSGFGIVENSGELAGANDPAFITGKLLLKISFLKSVDNGAPNVKAWLPAKVTLLLNKKVAVWPGSGCSEML